MTILEIRGPSSDDSVSSALSREPGEERASHQEASWLEEHRDISQEWSSHKGEQQGCFSVNSMREFAILPDEAYGVVTENRALLQRLLAMNIEAEKPRMAPSAIAEMVLSYFSGLCIERNLKSGKASSTRKIENFMTALRSL